jgi:hypothetical protein
VLKGGRAVPAVPAVLVISSPREAALRPPTNSCSGRVPVSPETSCKVRKGPVMLFVLDKLRLLWA